MFKRASWNILGRILPNACEEMWKFPGTLFTSIKPEILQPSPALNAFLVLSKSGPDSFP